MNIQKIQTATPNFQNSVQTKQKPEFIDKLTDAVRNQRDVNDCVAVPRGIFKAYILIMSGFGLIGIASALPARLKTAKSALNITGNILNILSAFYFAKPFAFKGVSPTVKKENLNS